MGILAEDDPSVRATLAAARLLIAYHRYEVRGLENVPRTGAALMPVSHSLATYDGFLLGAALYFATGRYPAALGDRRLFQTPGLAAWCRKLGMREGSPTAGERLLREGNLLMLAPGGMRESLRPSTERYRIRWEGRMGFARLAIRTQVPVLLAACPAADEIFTVYRNPITSLVYERFKWPLPLMRGIGLSVLPRPIKLVHYVHPPLFPPESGDDASVKEFHGRLVKAMESLLRNHR